MPWFYYSGPTPRSVPVKKGLSIALIPHTKVEIFDTGSRDVVSLVKKGYLRRTGKPVGAKKMADVPVTTSDEIKAVTPKSAMATKIAEKGVSLSKEQAPRKRRGSPEMTEGEINVATKEREEKEEVPSESVSGSDSPPENVDSVEVLSSADGSPDENEEGEEKSTSKKRKKRRK